MRGKNSLIVLVMCVIILVFAAIIGWSSKGQASSKVVWEYKAVYLGEQAWREMNELGAEGWELVQFVENDRATGFSGKYLFKRAK